MRAGFANRRILFNLACERTAQVHGTALCFICLQPQHTGGRKFVVCTAAARLLLHLHHVNRIPAALDLHRVAITSLLYQNNS